MKLTLITPALVAVLGLALSSVCTTVKADDTSAPAAATAPAAKKTKKNYGGHITAIDTSANTLTVQGGRGKAPLVLNVSDKTTYKGGSGLADFKVGDKVAGSYDKATLTAYSVNDKTVKADKAAAATPAAQ